MSKNVLKAKRALRFFAFLCFLTSLFGSSADSAGFCLVRVPPWDATAVLLAGRDWLAEFDRDRWTRRGLMYKDIVPWVMSRADHNDPKSQWVAAEMIIRSRGYDQCGLQGEALRKAQTLLQRSAEQGYEPAELRLSQIVAAASKRIRSGAKP